MQSRPGFVWTALAVVAVVELARLMSLALVVRYALFPPLAVIAYLAFWDPWGDLADWRSVVFLPVVGAALGILLVHLPEALGIAIGLLAIMFLMELAHAPPSGPGDRPLGLLAAHLRSRLSALGAGLDTGCVWQCAAVPTPHSQAARRTFSQRLGPVVIPR